MIQKSTLLSKSLKIPKGVIRSSNSKKRKSTNNGLQKHYTKKKIEQDEPHIKPGVNSDAPEG
jgi:hypothetical protein